MAGTTEGGKAAAKTNKRIYGDDFYARIGSRGGRNGNTGGFASYILCDCDLIEGTHNKNRCSGMKGGRIGKRGKKENNNG